MQQQFLLPGEQLRLEDNQKENMKIQSNCVQINKQNKQICAKISGLLESNLKNQKMYVNIRHNSQKYYPQPEDYVVGMIKSKSAEYYVLDIGAPNEANLSLFDFEGATKKSRPNLEVGQLIYCRVLDSNKFLRYKCSCINLKSKKEWTSGEALFGELHGGLSFNSGIQLAKLLLDTQNQGDFVLQYLQKYIQYEIAVGVNGRIWVKCKDHNATIIAVNVIQRSLYLDHQQIQQLVDQVIKRSIK